MYIYIYGTHGPMRPMGRRRQPLGGRRPNGGPSAAGDASAAPRRPIGGPSAQWCPS